MFVIQNWKNIVSELAEYSIVREKYAVTYQQSQVLAG